MGMGVGMGGCIPSAPRRSFRDQSSGAGLGSLGSGSRATRPERRNEEDEGFSQPCFKNTWKSIGMRRAGNDSLPLPAPLFRAGSRPGTAEHPVGFRAGKHRMLPAGFWGVPSHDPKAGAVRGIHREHPCPRIEHEELHFHDHGWFDGNQTFPQIKLGLNLW